MEPWVTIEELRVWTRKPGIPAEDPFALTVLKAATIVVSEETGLHYDDERRFTKASAPDRLKIIVAQVAKRAYLNPDQIRTEGAIGPLGGDTYAEAYAAGLELTEAEEETIAKVMEGFGAEPPANTLQVVRVGPMTPQRGGVYVPDSSGSDWFFPMA